MKTRTILALLSVAAVSNARSEVTPLVMQLDLPVRNVQFAGLLVAQRDGLYRTAGLDVSLRTLGQSVTYENIAKVVAASDDTVGSIESGLFLAGRAHGLPIVAIGVMFQQTPLCLMSFRSSGIRQPADLVGKRVCVNGDGQEALDAVLRRAGLKRSQLTVIEGDYGTDMLLEHRCDAKQGYLVDELVDLQLKGHDVVGLGFGANGYAAYSQVYFVSEATLARHRDALARFIQASSEGWRRALLDLPGTARFVVATEVPRLSVSYEERSLAAIAPLLTSESPRMAVMTRRTWSSNAEAFLASRPGASLGPIETWADFSVALSGRRL